MQLEILFCLPVIVLSNFVVMVIKYFKTKIIIFSSVLFFKEFCCINDTRFQNQNKIILENTPIYTAIKFYSFYND